jgi:16S rRNA (uracil1498-N3)-methyltransferase
VKRLFAPSLPAAGGDVALDEAAARHARVLRLRTGDAVSLFDGEGHEAEGEVVSTAPLVCRVGLPSMRPQPGPRVVLVQCLPKGPKLETIVRMTTELGVAAVHLAVAERSVARPKEGRDKLERLLRVAREAARQSGRSVVPEIVLPAPLPEVAGRAPAGTSRLLFREGATGALDDALARGSAAWIVVGPEGGLGDAEAAALDALGYRPIGLGAAILRVETAAVVAAALVLDRLGGLRAREDKGLGPPER